MKQDLIYALLMPEFDFNAYDDSVIAKKAQKLFFSFSSPLGKHYLVKVREYFSNLMH